MKKNKKRLLITGASGNLGKILACQAADEYQVFGTFDQHETQLNHVSFIQTDLTQPAMVKLLLKTVKPDAIIHLAAATRTDYCEEHSKRSWKINVEASGFLANQASELKIPFIYTSTDLVFNGRTPYSNEQTKADPICVYGRHKLEAEQMILARYSAATVCRLPTMMGGNSFLNQMLNQLKEGKSLRLFTDEIRSFAAMEDVAQGLLFALSNNWRGVWHLGGQEGLSRYALGQILCEVFDFDPALLLPTKQYLGIEECVAPRPRDVSLDSSKAFAQGYSPRAAREYIASLKR